MKRAPSVETSGRHRQLAHRSVLFTDVVESTRQLEAIGDEAWAEMIEHHHRTVQCLTRRHHGIVSNFTGDGFMSVFEHAADGIECALRLQFALVVQAELDVRVGISAGGVVEVWPDSFVGMSVHEASRLCACGARGQVLVLEQAYQDARRTRPLPDWPLHTLRIRGRSGTARVRVADRPDGPWLP